jgi:hypothetical protein
MVKSARNRGTKYFIVFEQLLDSRVGWLVGWSRVRNSGEKECGNGEEGLEFERLDHHDCRTRATAFVQSYFVAKVGDENDRCVQGQRPDMPEDVEAIQARHANVRDDERHRNSYALGVF